MSRRYALVHSPLVGPLSWSRVAAELRQRGLAALVPPLRDRDNSPEPYWRQEARSVADVVGGLPAGETLVLAGHSGAGLLLPAIWDAAGRPPAALVFVDAGIPTGTETRLDEMARTVPDFAEQLRPYLQGGGRFPEWTDADLAPLVPDDELRRELRAELNPRGLGFFDEPIPDVSGWRTLPCGYVQLSAEYAVPVNEARRAGWPCRELPADHFHLLVDPGAVASAIVAVVDEALAGTGRPA